MTDLIDQATSALAASADAARTAALVTIDAALRSVVEAAGGRIRGLQTLSNSLQAPVYGVRVRTRPEAAFPRPGKDEEHGKAGLLIDDEGRLLVGRCTQSGELETRPVRADELKAEDLGHVLGALAYALGRHAAALGVAWDRYERVRVLAGAIAKLLKEYEP